MPEVLDLSSLGQTSPVPPTLTHPVSIVSDEPPESSPPMGGLSDYVSTVFQFASDHRNKRVTRRLNQCQNQYYSKYEPEVTQAIEARGGHNVIWPYTQSKCSTVISWMRKVITSTRDGGKRPFKVEATPIPDLPNNLTNKISETATQILQDGFNSAIQQAEEVGVDPADVEEMFLDEVGKQGIGLYDKTLEVMQEEANKRAKRMENQIQDLFVEGGWYEAISDVIEYMAIYPLAVMKGPVFKSERVLSYNNKNEPVVVDKIKPTWYAINPFDYYPSPEGTDPQDGYICEKVEYSGPQLSQIKGTEGWSSKNIDMLLSGGTPDRLSNHLQGEWESRENDERDSVGDHERGEYLYDGIEFWGPVLVKDLKEWGIPASKLEGFKDEDYVEAQVVQLGKVVVFAMLNPHPLGLRPYYETQLSRTPNSRYGEALPELIRAPQQVGSAALRNMTDNMALSSGPSVAIDMDAMPDDADVTNIHERQIWTYHGEKVPGSRNPIQYFNSEINSTEYLNIIGAMADMGDTASQTPRIIQGDSDVSGAASTKGGLEILVDMSNKGMELKVSNLDDYIIEPSVNYMYDHLMRTSKDKSIKGDAVAVAQGVMAALFEERLRAQRADLLVQTNNDMDNQIIGVEGRAEILKQQIGGMQLPVEKIVPTAEQLAQRQQQQQVELQGQEQVQ